LRRHAHDGEVSHLAFQFDIRTAAASGRRRDTDFGQDFISMQRGGEEVGKKLGDWYRAFAIEASRHNLSPQGEEGRRVIVGRVSMGQVPTNGCEVAHQRVANDPSSVAHNRVFRSHEFRMLDIGLAGQRSYAQNAVAFVEIV
jgi:hypothetical protein